MIPKPLIFGFLLLNFFAILEARTQHGRQSRQTRSKQGTIIRFRIGESDDVGQCRCVLFYQCDNNMVVPLNDTAPPCDGVCCRLPNDFNPDNPAGTPVSADPLPLQGTEQGDPFSVSTPDPASEFIQEQTSSSISQPVTGTSSDGQKCTCIPKDQCHDETLISGVGVIDVRVIPCAPGEICCFTATSEPGSGSGSEPTPLPTPVPTPTHEGQLPTPQFCDCGIRRVEDDTYNIGIRIISTLDESQTRFGEFPWMGVILTANVAEDGAKTENVFQCGASLLYPSIVLTAAHCLVETDMSLLKVRMGEYDTHLGAKKEPLPHQERTISSITPHPKFNSGSLYNDIALIVTTEPFNITDNVNTICLPSNTTSYDPNMCVATGWGKDSFEPEGRFQTTLKKVDLSLVNRDECERKLTTTKLGKYFRLDSTFICAGGKPGKDTCKGDGGGPLVCAVQGEKNKYVQLGIVSWGIGCGSDVPGVYSSIEANLPWLSSEIDGITAGGIFRFGRPTGLPLTGTISTKVNKTATAKPKRPPPPPPPKKSQGKQSSRIYLLEEPL